MEQTILGNRYQIIKKIGDGGMAFVYQAKDTLLNRIVAVKVLRPEFADDQEFLAKFKREAEAVANITHPNIVNVYDVGQEDKTHYIVMEYVDGQNLKEIIRTEGVLDEYTALDIAKQIALALGAAHKKGVIHRDIKPHNILISREGRQVKVADFGIAKASSYATITNIGSIIGSVHYFSPEQAKGQHIAQNADLYSLGIVLYEMIIGKVPFTGDSPISIALQHINEPIEFTTEQKTKIPHSVRTLISKLTEKLAEDRYQSAEEVIEDIEYIEKNIDLDFIKEYDKYVTRKIDQEKLLEKSRLFKLEKEKFKEESLKEYKPVVEDEDDYDDYDDYEDEEEEEEVVRPVNKKSSSRNGKNGKKKKNKLAGIIPVVVGIILVAALAFFGGNFIKDMLSNGQQNEIEKIPVPNFVGQSIDDANRQANDMGLKIQQKEEYNAEVKKGYIISQTPNTGEVQTGDTIVVVVSLGGKEAIVPNCIGFDFAKAKELIEKNNLKVGSRSYQYSEVYDEGVVITQSPDSRTTGILENTEIALVISKGKRPQENTDNNDQNENNNNNSDNNNSGQDDNSDNNGSDKKPNSNGDENEEEPDENEPDEDE